MKRAFSRWCHVLIAPSLWQATTLHMNIEKGMKDGETITFEMMGEQKPKQIPGDIVFKLKQGKHKVRQQKIVF